MKQEAEEKGQNVTARRFLPEGAALVVLGPGGLRLAATLKPLLPGSDVHGLKGRAVGMDVGMDGGPDVGVAGPAAHLRDRIAQSRPSVRRRGSRERQRGVKSGREPGPGNPAGRDWSGNWAAACVTHPSPPGEESKERASMPPICRWSATTRFASAAATRL